MLTNSQITLDPVTKKFTQILPEEKVCYICSNNKFVDDHHYDCRKGKVSPETVPLCRRCHKTIHMFNGIHMFDDDLLDKAIEVWNMTEALFNRPLMTRDKIKRSNYWLKKHGVKKTVIFDPVHKRFIQEGSFTEEETKGSMTPIFSFHLPRGEPLCGWNWFNEHRFDLLDYVPRIEIVGPNIDLAVDINSKRELREVGKVLRGLKVRKDGKRKTITLDPVSKKFLEVK